MTPTGSERSRKPTGKARVRGQRGADSGAVASSGPGAAADNPDLAALARTWDSLPEAIRAGIIAMTRAAGG